MSTWDYADLSSKAKEAGGPEGLLRSYYHQGYSIGSYDTRREDIFIGLTLMAIGGLGKLCADLLRTKPEEPVIPQKDVISIESAIKEVEKENIAEAQVETDELEEMDIDIPDEVFFTETLFKALDVCNICDEDEDMIDIVQQHPRYPEFAEYARELKPGITDGKIVREFVHMMSYSDEREADSE